jgi:hypothetical protein
MAAISERTVSLNTLSKIKSFAKSIPKKYTKFIKLHDDELSYTIIQTEAVALKSLRDFQDEIVKSLKTMTPKNLYESRLIKQTPEFLEKIINYHNKVTADLNILFDFKAEREDFYQSVLENIFDVDDASTDDSDSSEEMLDFQNFIEKQNTFKYEQQLHHLNFLKPLDKALLNKIIELKANILNKSELEEFDKKTLEEVLSNKTSFELELISLRPNILTSDSLQKIISKLSIKQISILCIRPSLLDRFKNLYYFSYLTFEDLEQLENLIIKQQTKKQICLSNNSLYEEGHVKRQSFDYYEMLIQNLLFRADLKFTGKRYKKVSFDSRVSLRQTILQVEGNLLQEIIHREFDKIPINKNLKKTVSHHVHLERLTEEKKYVDTHSCISIFSLIENIFASDLPTSIIQDIFMQIERVCFTTFKHTVTTTSLECNRLYYNEFYEINKTNLSNVNDQSTINEIINGLIFEAIYSNCCFISKFLQSSMSKFIKEKQDLGSKDVKEDDLIKLLEPEILVFLTKTFVSLKDALKQRNLPKEFLNFLNNKIDAIGEPSADLNIIIVREIMKKSSFKSVARV